VTDGLLKGDVGFGDDVKKEDAVERPDAERCSSVRVPFVLGSRSAVLCLVDGIFSDIAAF
jgi:hypothetical protein